MPALTALAPGDSLNNGRVGGSDCVVSPALFDPDRLPDHIDALYRAACALCASRHEAEDLLQETFARVLKRPRFVRRDHELGYLLRALRNTYYSSYRAAARRPATTALAQDVPSAAPEAGFRASEIMEAVASAPPVFRDAVIAVDILGMSYKEAAGALRARQATITTRLHRGRQHVIHALGGERAIRPSRES
ncbi:MAG: RNA polymerase sigma factor [Solirubrobacterales bacterium]|nr:RNA polymerase sigma factor [Solirubrobacterales bacterium]